jgi:D-alanyl-D-alanine carboxypeptidase (penicillin-binding protein 5/6)
VQMDAVCGEQYYLKDLLYVMMMQSYNDVAVAIAEYIADVYMGEKQDFETVVNRTTAESEEKVRSFAGLMNEKAKKLGCHSTYFITPNGLDAQDENGIHSTTAVDMAKISAYAIKIPTVEEICTTKNHTFSEVNGKRNVSIGSTNRFLDMMDGAVGMKTGYTNDAGYCYVGAVKKDDKLLISVVFASGWPPHKNYKWADTKALMNYGINNFFYRNIFIPDKAYADIPVIDGVKKYVGTYIPFSLNLIMSGYEDVEVIYKIREKIIAPVKANEEVGIVCIYIDGKLFKTFSILTKESIDKKDFSWHFLNIFKEILF